MATVTVYTQARMLAIENGTVVSGTIDSAGHLQLTTRGGTPIDAGAVGSSSGPFVVQAATEPTASSNTGNLYWNTDTHIFYYSNGTTWVEVETGGSADAILSITAGYGITVDDTVPTNPEISLSTAVVSSADLAVVSSGLSTHISDTHAHDLAFDSFAQTLTQYSPKSLRTRFFLLDEFVGGTTTSGSIGTLGWTSLTVSGTPTLSLAPTQLDEPGCINLDVTATNDCVGIFLDPFLIPNPSTTAFIFEIRFRFNGVNTGTDDVYAKFGLADSTIVARPANCIQFEHATGSATVKCVTRANNTDVMVNALANGTGTVSPNIGPTLTDTWHTATIIGDGSASISFFYDDPGTFVSPLWTHTGASLPTIATGMTPRITLSKTNGASIVSRKLRIGYVYLSMAVVR